MQNGITPGGIGQDGTDSLEDRLAKRRVRRWKRRARIAGPFLAIPAMLGLLVLSVGVIEYQPTRPARPARAKQAEKPAEPRRVGAPSHPVNGGSPESLDIGLGIVEPGR